jgi:phosphatidylglycerophosphatase A|tara:strand:- start:2034 stop:2549 length:516 start_codon:yes stop_codon:yes gene_type:complete
MTPVQPPIRRLSFWHPARLIGTWFGVGLLPKAPGTWGSLAALPPAALLAWWGGSWALLGAALVAYLIGIWAAEGCIAHFGRQDPPEVVIDEVAGLWLALVPFCLDPLLFLFGFLAFRVFDIFKPFPASWADKRLKGGFGAMTDDIFAGLYAALAGYGLLWVWGRESCFLIF